MLWPNAILFSLDLPRFSDLLLAQKSGSHRCNAVMSLQNPQAERSLILDGWQSRL